MTPAAAGALLLVERVDSAIARGRGPEHVRHIDEALSDPAVGAATRAQLLLLRCRVHRQSMEYRLMLADAGAAADLFASLGDRAAEARALAMAAVAAAECGDVFAAADMAVRAQTASATVVPAGPDTAEDPWVLNRLGMLCHQMYDLDAAVTWWQAGLTQARRAGDTDTEILLVHNIAEATFSAVRLGDLDTATAARHLAVAQSQARWLTERAPDGDGRRRMPVDGGRVLAQILAAQGRARQAEDALAVAAEDLRPDTAILVRASYDAAEGYWHLVAGRPHGALAALDRALLPRPADAADLETLLVRRDRTDVLEGLGRHREALAESRRVQSVLLSRLRRHGGVVLREVDLRVGHERERSRLLRRADSLAQDVQHDPLTGAGNRRRLALLQATLAERPTVGALVLDLDRFKRVNDAHGHGLGDRVLVTTVRLVSACSRAGDDVIRLGGEEFLLVCPDTDRAALSEVAERVRASVAGHPWHAVAPGLQVTVSVGAAIGPGWLLDQVVARADTALLAAKANGRDRVEFDA